MLKRTLFSLQNQHVFRSRPFMLTSIQHFSLKPKEKSMEDFDMLMQSLQSKVNSE